MRDDVSGPDGPALSEEMCRTLELLNRVLPCIPPWGPGQYVNVERVALLLAAERERCAKLCEQTDEDGEGPDCWGWHSKDYARAIRGA